MPLKSDITIDQAKFGQDAISSQAQTFNEHLIEKLKSGPKWFEVGAPKYREMRLNGETSFPAPTLLPAAIDITIPSRDKGRDLDSRLLYPSARTSAEDRKKTKGSILHIHGGGWVLGDHKSTDSLLQFYADAGDVAVISVGYRVAPEDPFPAAPNDCIDAAEYLVKNSERDYGGPLRFIGGESAGGQLSLLTAIHLLKTRPDFRLLGLLIHFGSFDLSGLPQFYNFNKPLVLDREIMEQFIQAYLPGKTSDEKKDPAISPLFENLENFRGRLPGALFTCGTEDPLLDDTVFMGTKWVMAGGKAMVKIYPGAPHGFIAFPPQALKEAGEALQDTKTYIQELLRGA